MRRPGRDHIQAGCDLVLYLRDGKVGFSSISGQNVAVTKGLKPLLNRDENIRNVSMQSR